MKGGVTEGFGRELHHPVPVLKKTTLSTVEEELEGDRPVIKQAVEALWGSMVGVAAGDVLKYS